MLKAAVFDDEFIVTEGLKKMIDWSKYGIELVGTAANGTAALQLFQEQKPDVVFTDIRMPGIDGLQLVEKILSQAPETKCIVFSGFNEFEYVKRLFS
ncbi:response regulator [Metabacillus endolithicus]|uniref:response regulator n=1 Tax=Metabacillus endolithicus TaxID=1535204 RepID=UPI001FFBED3C|nr:response regulator [Metabacillus endolithicus]UPG62663.1 response regulator [Metabacillus endolithicus]